MQEQQTDEIPKQEDNQSQTTEGEGNSEGQEEKQEQEQNQGNDAIGGAEAIQEENKNLSQDELDIQNVKNTTGFIKPVNGVVSSKYGQRDTATGNVPKNHTGTDIAANLGTKIISATDGEVVLSSEEGDYGKHLKIQIGEVSVIYAHCNQLYVKQGDKIANRHGNKGVTPELRSNTEMPMFKNGEFVDLCYNPAGVSSRMNIGQILECNLGLAGYILGVRMRSDSFNGASVEEIKMLLSYAWHLANEDDVDYVNKQFSELPIEFKEVCIKNLTWIRTWKGSFNEDGTAWMLNPRTGKYFETPVVVGINYIYKLVHEVTKKTHARGGFATEPYIEKTSAPTHGSSKLGGQRFGEMEIDALSAYGVSAFIQELMNGRGDNPVARNNLTVKAMHKGNNYMLDEKTGIRRSTEEFVNRMEALGVKIEFEEELPNNTKIENAKRITYTAKKLITTTNVGKRKDNQELKSFDAFSNFLPNFGAMVSSMHRKTGCDSSSPGISFSAMEAVTFMNLE